MIRYEDIRKKADRLWTGKQLFRDWLEPMGLFPFVIPTGTPKGKKLTERFSEVKPWAQELKAQSKACYDVEYAEVRHQQLGLQHLPARIVIPSREACLRLLRRQATFDRFQGLVERTLPEWPDLKPIFLQHPLEVLDAADDWDLFLSIGRFFVEHPRPDLYLRQLDLPGVDTKFIENNRRMVRLLLDAVLPEDAIAVRVTRNTEKGFAERFGLRSDPPRLRLRILDPSLYVDGLSDLEIPVADLDKLPTAIQTVFITENKTNGLSFPDYPQAMIIFGLGYGLDVLASNDWLRCRRLYYWGDIDTHGFNILNQLRKAYPDARSILMDDATLRAHLNQCVHESAAKRCTHGLAGLTDKENETYQALVDNRYGTCLRLEQERIRYSILAECLDHLRSIMNL